MTPKERAEETLKQWTTRVKDWPWDAISLLEQAIVEAEAEKEQEAREHAVRAANEARSQGIQAEHADCVRLLSEARKLYEKYNLEAWKKEKAGGKDPDEARSVTNEWFAKMTAVEYCILVIDKWRTSEDYKPGHLPMPF